MTWLLPPSPIRFLFISCLVHNVLVTLAHDIFLARAWLCHSIFTLVVLAWFVLPPDLHTASFSTLLAQLKCHLCRGHYSSYSIPTPVIPYQIILFHLLHSTYHHIHAYVHIYIVVSMKV